MAESRLNRVFRQVRRWRSEEPADGLTLSPELTDSDIRRLRPVIDACIEGKGGELAARRRATSIGSAFLGLDETGQRRFFDLLAVDYDHDDNEVDHAIAAVVRSSNPNERRRAEHHLRDSLEPRRERLLKRFVGIDGGLAFLITLREELLPIRKESSALLALDDDLRTILASWFDVALLKLERLDWDTPAAVLEKLIEYEAVHAIESWEDLRGRLGPSRRCYGYFHPSMPGEPLIFVEVALTRGISSELPLLLDHDALRIEAEDADTAIFYSISNCHRGLAGVSLGDFLIKRVVEELKAPLPNVNTFATLSPIPGFRRWLDDNMDDPDLLSEAEKEALGDDAVTRFEALASGPKPSSSKEIEMFRPILLGLAARYLTTEGKNGRAIDAVANFHLTNGARVERVNFWANPSDAGWDRGLAMMVNYRYQLESIESNHDDYVSTGTINRSSAVTRLIDE